MTDEGLTLIEIMREIELQKIERSVKDLDFAIHTLEEYTLQGMKTPDGMPIWPLTLVALWVARWVKDHSHD